VTNEDTKFESISAVTVKSYSIYCNGDGGGGGDNGGDDDGGDYCIIW
jgi:hypothetical protein